MSGLDGLPLRIVAKIERTATCWLWTGATMRGYGRVWNGRSMSAAHRLVFEALVGPIPEGLHLDHLCRNRSCVNPEHLEPVTQAVNNRRAADAITHCPKGHEYTPENTRWRPHPKAINLLRGCRTCDRMHSKAARQQIGVES